MVICQVSISSATYTAITVKEISKFVHAKPMISSALFRLFTVNLMKMKILVIVNYEFDINQYHDEAVDRANIHGD